MYDETGNLSKNLLSTSRQSVETSNNLQKFSILLNSDPIDFQFYCLMRSRWQLRNLIDLSLFSQLHDTTWSYLIDRDCWTDKHFCFVLSWLAGSETFEFTCHIYGVFCMIVTVSMALNHSENKDMQMRSARLASIRFRFQQWPSTSDCFCHQRRNNI